MTKTEVCVLIDGLWVSKAHRDGLKYKIKTRTFTPSDLDEWGGRFKRALDKQQELVMAHASGAADAQEVQELSLDYSGIELKKKKRMAAGRLLRQVIKEQAGLTIPADLSRSAVEQYV